MIFSQAMNDALNTQIGNELFASFSYRQMAFELEELGLKIFSARFHEQAAEEHEHAMKMAEYIENCGGQVKLNGIDAPKHGHGSCLSMVEAALESERLVSRQIFGLMNLAESEKDHSTRSFLKWFVDEQVEEVASMSDLVQLVKMAGDSNLFMAEQRLSELMKAGANG